MFIAIEGQDGAGKDTQAKLLQEHYEKQGKKVVTYAESGTDSSDEFLSTIARLNYGSNQYIGDRTRAMLYLVNRYEQWRRLAEPTLKNSDIVIITRYWLSTLILTTPEESSPPLLQPMSVSAPTATNEESNRVFLFIFCTSFIINCLRQ